MPHAPQFGSDFRLLHAPRQAATAQQTYFPHEPPSRLVLPLQARQAAGLPIDRIASVASFFVSRVDTLVDKLLDEKIAAASDETTKGWLTSLKGKAGIANAKIAYQSFEKLFSGAEWEELRAVGARVQRPLWASTSVKNPDYPDTMYVDGLIGPHTVDTLPRATTAAFLDHGTVENSVSIKDYRVAAGFGFRIAVPALGPLPIALDFAFPLNRAPWDNRQMFSFYVGLFGGPGPGY